MLTIQRSAGTPTASVPVARPAQRERPTLPIARAFRLGRWLVEPSLGRITSDALTNVVEPKTMDVLVQLAARAGEVVSSDQLIDSVWLGRPMGDNPVHKCVSQLRSALCDDARHPRYIGTIPRRGYRLLECVEPVDATPVDVPATGPIRVCIDIWPLMRGDPGRDGVARDLVQAGAPPAIEEEISAVVRAIAHAIAASLERRAQISLESM